MKPALLLAVGITLGVAATHWQRPVAWIMTRIPPATHPDCAPRSRVWHHGVEVSCPPLLI